MVLKIGPDRPVGLVEPSTGELSSSVHLNESSRSISMNCQTVRFFANRPHLNPTNIYLPFQRPIIHQAHSMPNTFKTKTNKPIFGPSHQAQSNDKKTHNTFIWVTPPGLICWFAWLEGILQGIYRAHGAHKIHVLPMWDWE